MWLGVTSCLDVSTSIQPAVICVDTKMQSPEKLRRRNADIRGSVAGVNLAVRDDFHLSIPCSASSV